MFARIAAIGGIIVATSIAWIVLGSTILARTYQRGPGLKDKVVDTWGGPHAQRSPSAFYREARPDTTLQHAITLETTRATVDLHLEHRQKGLLWYSTYGVKFAARYGFRNPSPNPQEVLFRIPLSSDHAIYDAVLVTLDGRQLNTEIDSKSIRVSAPMAAGASATLAVSYRSQGLDTWSYEFGDGVSQVRDFSLTVCTDFDGFDFPEGSLSPSSKRPQGSAIELTWSYTNLMTGQQIRIAMPEKLQPGPVAGQISFFAPVSLLFFFFVLFIITTLRGIDLHPANYFFVAAAFFAFHLLFAYLVDHLSLYVSFTISSVVSVFLVVSYLRLVVGTRFALVEAAGAQIVYLVLFSSAFFFEGYTGLSVSIGAILTLFIAMQMTARVPWLIRP